MQLVDIPEPQTAGNLVKIKVAYAGICGTDIHTFEGVYTANKPPVVLGQRANISRASATFSGPKPSNPAVWVCRSGGTAAVILPSWYPIS